MMPLLRAPLGATSRSGPAARLVPAVLLALAVMATYATALPNDFVWDDHPIIVQGPVDADLGAVQRALTTPDVALKSQPAPYYRPLTRLTFVLERQLFGLDPLPFHIVSVALHLAATIALFALARRLSGRPGTAFVAALLFAIHPVNAETVNFVSARNNALVAFFTLTAFAAHLRARESGSPGRLLVAVTLFLLALLSKETGIMLMPFLALFELSRGQPWAAPPRLRAIGLTALAVVAAAYLGVRAAVLSAPGAASTIPLAGMGEALVRAVHVAPKYLALVIFPRGLTVHHLEPEAFLPGTLSLAAVWAAILAATVLLVRQRRPVTRLGLLWFAVHLLPVSGIVAIPSAPLAERYLYVPAIGLWLVAADQLAHLAGRLRRPGILAWTALAAATALATLTARRNLDWRDDLALFSSAARVEPRSAEAAYNHAVALDARGDAAGAREEWDRALRNDPAHLGALARLGTYHAERGAYDAAASYFARVLAIRPDHVETRFNLALLLERLGRPADALAHYQEFLRLDPVDYPELAARVRARVRALGGSAPEPSAPRD